MSECSNYLYEKRHIDQAFIQQVSYHEWYEKTLEKYEDVIADMLETLSKPLVLVLEIGHFSLPLAEKNVEWAAQNIAFANALCGKLINRYKKEIRIIPTLLINNLERKKCEEIEPDIEKLFSGNKYIDFNSVQVISERNLKNRAYKSVKKVSALTNSITHKDGKAYLNGSHYKNNALPVGLLNEKGEIVPRCGLIINCYLDKVVTLAKNRMHQHDAPNILLVSFSQHRHEYERVMLGVDTHAQANQEIHLSAIVSHWSYLENSSLCSYRQYLDKSWQHA